MNLWMLCHRWGEIAVLILPVFSEHSELSLS
jgi:hypothetical protein